MRHGTYTGYTAHACRCDSCREAARAYAEKYRATPHGRAKTNAQARAENRAFVRLRKMHPRDWSDLLHEETAKEPILNIERVRSAEKAS